MPKIDEKRLDELLLCESYSGVEIPNLTKNEAENIIRLARLGIWTEEYGAPAIDLIEEIECLRDEIRVLTHVRRHAVIERANKDLWEENQRFREALEFYAKEDTHRIKIKDVILTTSDCGKRAREALDPSVGQLHTCYEDCEKCKKSEAGTPKVIADPSMEPD